MVRVLIVDDSATIRRILKRLLESDPEIVVVDTAADGREGVQKAIALGPDLILMDIRMPVMDGFEATRQIMEKRPTPIVIVSTGVNDPNLNITFNAIRAGALEVVEKPVGVAHEEFEHICERLVTTVKLMAEVKVIRRRRSTGRADILAPPPPARRERSLVVMGASTGGPAALYKVLHSLPASFPLPIAIVQHLTPGFTDGLADWLQQGCKLPVQVVRADQRIERGRVYLAPTQKHLEVRPGGMLALSDAPPVSHVRPSVTVLFESAARVYGAGVIGVLLTGMGDDGAAGLKCILDAGGLTMAQDAASCVVFGMPAAAVALGAATHLLSLESIAPTLVEAIT